MQSVFVSPVCSKAAPQCGAAILIFHGWDASFSLFPSNIILTNMNKQFNFTFIKPQSTSPKMSRSSSLCPSSLCQYRTGFSFSQHPYKVFRWCSEVHLHISHQSMFISGTQKSSPSWDDAPVCSYVVFTCPLLLEQMNVAPRGIWKLYPSMNQAYEAPRFPS